MKKSLGTMIVVPLLLIAAQAFSNEARAADQAPRPNAVREMLDSELAISVGKGFEYDQSNDCRGEAQDFESQSTESVVINPRCKEDKTDDSSTTIMTTTFILIDPSAKLGQKFYRAEGARITFGPAGDPDAQERCGREAAHLNAQSSAKLAIDASCYDETTNNATPKQVVLRTTVTVLK